MEVIEWCHRQGRTGRRIAALSTVLVLGSVASVAQNSSPKIYQQGSQWVQEFGGFAPISRVLKVMMSVGSIHLEGGAQEQINYTVRERCVRSTQEAARKIFDQFRVFSTKKADATVIQGDWIGGKPGMDLTTEVFVQLPSSVDAVALNAREGNITVRAIRAKLHLPVPVFTFRGFLITLGLGLRCCWFCRR